MSSSQAQSVYQPLSWTVFHQIADLLQQTVGTEAVILTETQALQSRERFVLVASPRFSALLQATAIDRDQCQIQLTFSPDKIAAFLAALNHSLPFALQANHSDRQSEFTLNLINILARPGNDSVIQHQVEQERLLNQVTALIRHSLDLPVILETAVHQVREFLQADRVIIYQFNFPAPSCLLDGDSEALLLTQSATPNLDGITYESRSSETVASILNLMNEYSAASLKHLQKRHQSSLTWANNGNANGSTVASLLKQPAALGIQAELVTPILVQEQLWGLLIVHQCQQPRQWHDREKLLLQRIAEHLAIAIYQAKLYSELQQQKSTLEQHIIDRTQALHDTLIAAQAASRAKSEFLSTMSHELRTPLTTILGMASTLSRAFQEEAKPVLTPQKQSEYLHIIQERGEHLLALINDLLDLSEVEAGKMLLQLQEFSLAKLARQSIQLVQARADAKQVELSLQLLPAQERSPHDFLFQADPQRVQQICLNLLSNAIKFTPEKGRVILRVRVSRETAILQVEDTGIGIPIEQRSLLFQKFKQLDGSYHRKYEGTGLGLALTKQLVELHGGTIEVDSTVGVGSKFTVFLPSP